jgi:hypothetical protein
MLGLMKTCRKLRLSFYHYLCDRWVLKTPTTPSRHCPTLWQHALETPSPVLSAYSDAATTKSAPVSPSAYRHELRPLAVSMIVFVVVLSLFRIYMLISFCMVD